MKKQAEAKVDPESVTNAMVAYAEKKEEKNNSPKRSDEFAEAYELLCKEHGLQIAFQPQWKQSLDTGVFSLIIVPMVVEFKTS